MNTKKKLLEQIQKATNEKDGKKIFKVIKAFEDLDNGKHKHKALNGIFIAFLMTHVYREDFESVAFGIAGEAVNAASKMASLIDFAKMNTEGSA